MATSPHTTRRAVFSAAPVVALAPAVAVAGERSAVSRLQAEWQRYFDAANEESCSEAETARLIDLADAVEDRIRALDTTSDEVALAQLRVVARETCLGVRYNAEVSAHDLAARVLAYFGERA